MTLFFEILVFALIISALMWFFGVDGSSVVALWGSIVIIVVVLLLAGAVLGIGVQISYIVFPIAG